MRRSCCLVLLCALAACESNGSARLTFGANTSEGEEDEGTEATGDGDGDPDGDGDGDDPTTTAPGDGDGDDPTTTATGDGDGDDPTTTNGDGDGDDPTDDPPEPCARNRYVYQPNIDSWEVLPLNQLWAGPNAPPCSATILGTTQIQAWNQLLVWTADGMYYRRVNGNWQPPEPTSQRWGVVADIQFTGVSNIPPFADLEVSEILFGTAGTVYNYEMYEDGAAIFDQTLMVEDGLGAAPPAGSLGMRWGASLARPDIHPSPEWLTSYQFYGDGLLYRLIGFNDWTSWALAQSPLFTNPPNGLDPNAIEAAWGSTQPERIYLVGP